MQNQTTTATLTTVLSEVLANLAFMFTDDGECDVSAGERWLETTIRYDGPVSGTLRLVSTRTFATQMAANLLGVDADENTTEEEAVDAIKEFMNVVCGQYVTAAYGTAGLFNLTIPESAKLTSRPVFGGSEEASDEAARLSVDGQWIEVFHRRRA